MFANSSTRLLWRSRAPTRLLICGLPFIFSMEQKHRLAHIYFQKKRLVMWRRAHGPGSDFRVCNCLAGSFLRFDSRRAQLVRVVRPPQLAASPFADASADNRPAPEPLQVRPNRRAQEREQAAAGAGPWNKQAVSALANDIGMGTFSPGTPDNPAESLAARRFRCPTHSVLPFLE